MTHCIILHNMIIEDARDGYNCEIFEQEIVNMKVGIFIDANAVEKTFWWRNGEAFATTRRQ